MEQFVMDARKRDKNGTGAARAYRREGLIPATVYGHGEEATSILVEARQLQGLLRHHGSVINLKIDGASGTGSLAALLKETQRDPISREVLSVDLQWVSLMELIEVTVPVTLVGSAPGVTRDGGSLDQVMHEIAISCLPGDIPDHIEADISELEIGKSVHVRDLTAPEGVTLMSPPDDAVVAITRPIRAEELETHLEEGEAVAVEGASEEEAPKSKTEEAAQ